MYGDAHVAVVFFMFLTVVLITPLHHRRNTFQFTQFYSSMGGRKSSVVQVFNDVVWKKTCALFLLSDTVVVMSLTLAECHSHISESDAVGSYVNNLI